CFYSYKAEKGLPPAARSKATRSRGSSLRRRFPPSWQRRLHVEPALDVAIVLQWDLCRLGIKQWRDHREIGERQRVINQARTAREMLVKYCRLLMGLLGCLGERLLIGLTELHDCFDHILEDEGGELRLRSRSKGERRQE